MTTQLIILPNGRAKEVHPMGEEPERYLTDMFNDSWESSLWKEWKQVESSLKEYRITTQVYEIGSDWESIPVELTKMYPPGTIVTCEVNQEEGTCIIL